MTQTKRIRSVSVFIAGIFFFITLAGPLAPNAAEVNAVVAKPTASPVSVNGEQKEFTAYNVGGNNYFKLRDVMQVFDVGVDYDKTANTISINTTKSYEDPSNVTQTSPPTGQLTTEQIDKNGKASIFYTIRTPLVRPPA